MTADIFQEKPKRVEARQFDGDTDALLGVLQWIQDGGYVWFDLFTPAPPRGVSISANTGFLNIVDSDGNLSGVQKGDWIIKLPTGDFQKISASDFEATYASVPTPVQPEAPVDPPAEQ